MSAIIKGLKFAPQLTQKNVSVLYSVTRNHWNKDYKAAPFPKTDEERIAAAKKYNILPEEYKPYADDGLGYGDYPKLPDIPVETRDPNYPYDFPEHKRNFHEPIHADIDMYGEDRYGTAEPLRFSVKTQALAFGAVMVGFFSLYYWLEDKHMYRPVSPKQYPGDGKVHYTFERK